MLRLHHFPLSPFCRKVRLALAEKRLRFETIAVRPWEAPVEPLQSGLLSGVTSLTLDSGETLRDARAIAEYLEDATPSPPLMPRDPVGRAEVRRLVNRFDEAMFNSVTAVVLDERVIKRFSMRASRDPDLGALRTAFDIFRDHLSDLGRLIDERDCLAGALSLADFTASSHLSCLDYFGDVPWKSFPAVRDWYARIKSRPSFRPLLQDSLPGFAPAAEYANLDF
jgi:glutathione S-transferase